jgi:hypothetical protein
LDQNSTSRFYKNDKLLQYNAEGSMLELDLAMALCHYRQLTICLFGQLATTGRRIRRLLLLGSSRTCSQHGPCIHASQIQPLNVAAAWKLSFFEIIFFFYFKKNLPERLVLWMKVHSVYYRIQVQWCKAESGQTLAVSSWRQSQVAAVYVVCMSIRQYLPLETYNLPVYLQKSLTWRYPAV